jgi:hypothetical protein
MSDAWQHQFLLNWSVAGIQAFSRRSLRLRPFFSFSRFIHGQLADAFTGGHGERERQKGIQFELTSYRNLN